jgi:hypothetical protein
MDANQAEKMRESGEQNTVLFPQWRPAYKINNDTRASCCQGSGSMYLNKLCDSTLGPCPTHKHTRMFYKEQSYNQSLKI